MNKSSIRRGNAHKYGEQERIDPDKYKDFIGDLRGTGIGKAAEQRGTGFDLIDNAIPIAIMNEITPLIRNSAYAASPRDPSPRFR